MTLAVATLAFCLLVLWRDRHEHASRLRANQQTIDAVLSQLECARRDWQDERKDLVRQHDRTVQTLLNRIKPETGQYVPTDEPLYAPPAVNPEIDDDFWEAKDELAERIMAQELAQEAEAA